jgi:excinuclease ABC subunit A
VNAPVVRDRKGEFRDVLEELRRDGFTRVKVDGEQRLLEDEIRLDKKFKHAIEVVVDRLVIKPDLRQRLTQSIETAASLAEGLGALDLVDTDEQLLFSENFACPDHGVSLPELEPRIFSFNSPHGACPRCTGLGAQLEVDPDLLVPDTSLSIADGALVPWSLGGQGFYESVIQAIADRYEIALDVPWRELAAEDQDRFSTGRAATDCSSPTATAWGESASTRWRSKGSCPTSSAGTARRTLPSSASGSRSTCRCGSAPSAGARVSSRRFWRSRSAGFRPTRSR